MSQIFQSAYTQRNSEAYLGQITEALNAHEYTTRIARGIVKSGYGLFRVAGNGAGGDASGRMLDPGEGYQIPNPGLGAVANSIATGTVIKSAAAPVTYAAAVFDGVVGAAEMQPGRQITITFDSSTDWDPTTGVLTYVDAATGQTKTENISVATSTTWTSTGYASSVVSVYFPTQTGAGGTATVGVAALTLAIGDFLGVVSRQPIKSVISANGLWGYPGQTSTLVTGDYVDGEAVPVLTRGGIYVFTEVAVAEGDPVYVRKAAGTFSALGAFRNDSDSSSAVQIPGALFTRTATAAGIARMRLPAYNSL